MNKVKKKVYRNTTSFNMMAWGSFAFLLNNKKRSLKRLFLFAENAQIF